MAGVSALEMRLSVAGACGSTTLKTSNKASNAPPTYKKYRSTGILAPFYPRARTDRSLNWRYCDWFLTPPIRFNGGVTFSLLEPGFCFGGG